MHAIEDLTEGNVLTIEVDSITKIELYNSNFPHVNRV